MLLDFAVGHRSFPARLLHLFQDSRIVAGEAIAVFHSPLVLLRVDEPPGESYVWLHCLLFAPLGTEAEERALVMKNVPAFDAAAALVVHARARFSDQQRFFVRCKRGWLTTHLLVELAVPLYESRIPAVERAVIASREIRIPKRLLADRRRAVPAPACGDLVPQPPAELLRPLPGSVIEDDFADAFENSEAAREDGLPKKVESFAHQSRPQSGRRTRSVHFTASAAYAMVSHTTAVQASAFPTAVRQDDSRTPRHCHLGAGQQGAYARRKSAVVHLYLGDGGFNLLVGHPVARRFRTIRLSETTYGGHRWFAEEPACLTQAASSEGEPTPVIPITRPFWIFYRAVSEAPCPL